MAPCGDFSTLRAACNAGADAIYLGVDDFSMRSGKRNFKVSDLAKVKNICNSYPRKPKVYLTINTIVYEEELKKLEKLLLKAKKNVDAVIVSDFAAIKICKKEKIPFFVSTQMSVANSQAAEFFKKQGAKRVVVARELNLNQIKKITQVKGLEVEVFVHGAMCVAVSGRCFTSQFLFNRSANRGECLHPCRRAYHIKDKEMGFELELENDTVMSAKDLCTLPFVEKLKKTGVSSFKIEGRNRDARYVDTVVRVYREAIDKKLTLKEVEEKMKELQNVFHRDFSSGFYLGKPLVTDFAQVENSASAVYKEYVGKVSHYYSKIGVATLRAVKTIRVGDELIFIGEQLGVKNITVKEMEMNKEKVKTVKKGDEFGIKTPVSLPKNTEVYRLKKRTL